MMKNTKNYEFSNKLNEVFKNKIKLSVVSKQSVIIITTDDEFYEFRRDSTVKILKNSLIALSLDKKKIEELIKESFVEDLSFKNVIDIKNGWSHSIARTSDGKFYSWGQNVKGVIGNGDENIVPFKPELNKFLKDKNVIDMCCGYYHTLVLTFEKEVYCWGLLNDHESIKPKLLTNNVEAISCGSEHSLVLTEKGQVYELGKRDWINPQTREDYQLLKLSKKIKKIACGLSHSLLWSCDGDIYICGSNKNGELGTGNQNNVSIPHLIKGEFTDIASNIFHKFIIARSKDKFFYIWGECGTENIKEPQKITDFESFNDIFEEKFQITYEPTEGKVIRFNDDYIQNDKYKKDFTMIKKLGEGSFGEVFEVSEMNDSHEAMRFAIKKIKFVNEREKEFWKELETSPIISELSDKNIVKYFDVWLENDFKSLILHIRMELCDVDLYNLIKDIKKDKNFLSETTLQKILTPLGYYIASGIFIEILEGVDYLHTRNPPIIHRDLNPSNIMLKFEKLNKCSIKITDLGLATIHELAMEHTIGDRGHVGYVAPEVIDSSNYDNRADIYSLGVVLEKIFCFDIRNFDIPLKRQCESILLDKYKETDNLRENMTKRDKTRRLKSIEEILDKKQFWSLNVYELSNIIDFEKLLENNEHNELFTYKLLQARQFYDLLIKNGKYGEKFTEKSRKTEESYGEVFEVNKNDQKIEFAMKKIKLAKENKKELMEKLKNSPLTFKLKHRKIIEVSDIWLENDKNFKLYILMELYDISLFEMINEIKADSNFNSNKILTSLGYFIASEIFIEILEGVKFIHKQTPAIIHRYLNPWNITLKIDEKNKNSSVKIADTGLEAIHAYITQSEAGEENTQKYLAPEIMSIRESADLFSLGRVLEDLFQIDRDTNYNELEEPLLSKYTNLKNSLVFMTHKQAIMRSADVEYILENKDSWALNANEFKFKEEFETVSTIYRNKESFVFRLLKNKY